MLKKTKISRAARARRMNFDKFRLKGMITQLRGIITGSNELSPRLLHNLELAQIYLKRVLAKWPAHIKED